VVNAAGSIDEVHRKIVAVLSDVEKEMQN